MRRLFLLMLLVLVAAAGLAYRVGLDAGYVRIDYRDLSIETSLWFAALLAVVGFILFYYTGRMLLLGVDVLAKMWGPKTARITGWRGWMSRGRLSTRGVIAFEQGNWRKAAHLLARGARKTEAPLINYLLAARASRKSGDPELAEGFLQLAADLPGGGPAATLARARIHLEAGEQEQASRILEALPPDQAMQPAAVDMLLQALEYKQDWGRIVALLPDAQRLRARSDCELQTIETRVYRQLLSVPATPSQLDQTWRSLPAYLRQNADMLASYAKALLDAGASADAHAVLMAALKLAYCPALIAVYGSVAAVDSRRQQSFAEGFLQDHPDDPDLLLALGRISRRSQLWGKAREYLERSLARRPTAAACAELALFYEQTGDLERSRQMLRRALN